MSDPWGEPWSNNTNAPRIPFWVHTAEKEGFVGRLAGAILYGIVVAFFFQCTGALINPTNNMRRTVKWGLLAQTVTLFLVLTIRTSVDQYAALLELVDNRSFPGTDTLPPGPVGYDTIHSSLTQFTIYVVTFPLNQWLSDGLLLYRCYVIYSMNYWAMALPCLLYISSIAMGIAHINEDLTPSPATVNIDTSYVSICLSLNVILTLMIIIRLILHSRNIRHATGTSGGTTGLYTTIITMLVESYALYAVSLVFYIVPWALQSWVVSIPSKILGPIQVVAPYLIVLRVARRRASTSKMITSGPDNIGSMQFRSQATTDFDGSLVGGNRTGSTSASVEAPGEVDAGAKHGIEEVSL